MEYDLERLIEATHGVSFEVRTPSRKSKQRDAIRLSILENIDDVIIPAIPCTEMIKGFIPHLLKWHQQSLNDNAVPLIKYAKAYYGDDLPEFLAFEFENFSDTDYKCIEYFPYIYQKVFLYQLEQFRIKDAESLNDARKKYLTK